MQREATWVGAPPELPPLDREFLPASWVMKKYRDALAARGNGGTLRVAIERERGCIHRDDLPLLAENAATGALTWRVAERHLKMLLWAYGGWRIVLSGPERLCRALAAEYSPGGARSFDVALMERIYGQTFRVEQVEPEALPEARSFTAPIGGHLDGCRVGFDLGASDYKLAAVRDGTAVFSREIPWKPSVESDPAYHYERILGGIREAASHLPRLDAVGGSSAGIYIDNEVRVASLFRAVPPARFDSEVRPMFKRLEMELGVPVVVVNDGDVTALAGALSLKRRPMFGIAMGSSEAVGYLDRNGCISGALNELAFAPVDFRTDAPVDEWSGDGGVGAQYFSQQAANRLALNAGWNFPADMGLPERLAQVQRKMEAGDSQARLIFETIGVYLGYALPYYAAYYDYSDALILGRVSSGAGGDAILSCAARVLRNVFPEASDRIRALAPDERSRRVGQAVAAASLPALPR